MEVTTSPSKSSFADSDVAHRLVHGVPDWDLREWGEGGVGLGAIRMLRLAFLL